MLAQAALPTTSATWVVVAFLVLLVIAVVAIVAQRRRSRELRKRFGPEYDRTVETAGSQKRAEAELAQREKRHRGLDIRPLTPGARDRYAESWRTVQGRFVDEPGVAVGDADKLVNEVMRDRGYPADDGQHRMEDLSVEHARVLENYRTATAIAQRNTRGEASTEELRQALVSYRALFADLLGADSAGAGTAEGRIVEPRRSDRTQGANR